jgi:hypothetical protein
MPAQEPNLSITPAPRAGAHTRCQCCGCKLGVDQFDDFITGYCSSCKTRPEIRRLLDTGARPRPAAVTAPTAPASTTRKPSKAGPMPREFTASDMDLIRNVHGYMPHQDLLKTLNERLRADRGDLVPLYTIDQLHQAIEDVGSDKKKDGPDWASLRKLLAHAKRSGLLEKITGDVIDTFAVVFRLNASQVLHVKDSLLRGNGE